MPVAETITRPSPVQETATSGSRTLTVSEHRPAPFYMDGGVLYHWGTQERKLNSSEDLGIFTGPHRTRTLLERNPEVTIIVQDRELVSRAEIFNKERV